MGKLAAIYNAWDGIELLQYSIRSVASGVDLFIIVYQIESNFGELYNPLPEIHETISLFPDKKFILHYYTPQVSGGATNEVNKRNKGLDIAKEQGATHFLHMDCDECYENFEKAKQEYIDSDRPGSICPILTYFKKPTLRFADFDNYYVPFIHELHPDTEAGHAHYPFYVDPTRRVNCQDVALLTEPMHHFSYIRRDINRKCRNSSARANIEKSQLLADYNNPECVPGFYVKDFGQKLIEAENLFNIEI